MTLLFDDFYGFNNVPVYSYLMPACSIVKTITPRCRGRPDALLASIKSGSGRPQYRGNHTRIIVAHVDTRLRVFSREAGNQAMVKCQSIVELIDRWNSSVTHDIAKNRQLPRI